MAKLIIVAGVPGAGKSTVLVEAWKQVEQDLHYSIVSFGTEMLNLCLEAGLVSDRDEMRTSAPTPRRKCNGAPPNALSSAPRTSC